jgi:hypothetical protein
VQVGAVSYVSLTSRRFKRFKAFQAIQEFSSDSRLGFQTICIQAYFAIYCSKEEPQLVGIKAQFADNLSTLAVIAREAQVTVFS